MGLGGDELYPNFLFELIEVQSHSPRLRDIHHVQRDQNRQADLHHLGNKKKIPLKIAGVDHTENRIRTG